MWAPLRESSGELPCSSSRLVAIELPGADQIDQAVGEVEAHAHAGRRCAALVAERERRAHRHSRFQLAVGRNDERPEPLRQRRCSRRKNFRQGAHDAVNVRRARVTLP